MLAGETHLQLIHLPSGFSANVLDCDILLAGLLGRPRPGSPDVAAPGAVKVHIQYTPVGELTPNGTRRIPTIADT